MAKNAFDEINKKYGSGTIHKLTSEFRLSTSVIPTGSLNLDVALGVGGIPTGRIIEIVGPESSGKSTLCQHIVANCQALGGTVAYIDVENALDPTWMETCGIDVNECYIVQPDYGEQALDIVQILLPSVNLVIVDSVAALVPKSELEGEIGDSVTGDTPVIIRRNKKYISIVSIASLYGSNYNFYGKRYTKRYKKLKSIEILTASGWKKATCIVLKFNRFKKPIIVTNTLNGISQTTKDHSLFVNGTPTSPVELKIGDLLDTYKPECNNSLCGINRDTAWIIGYFCAEGSKYKNLVNCFTFADTTEENIDLCINKLNNNFTVYTRKKVTEKNDGVRKPLFHIYVSGDNTLSTLLNQCFDEKLGEKRIPDIILNSDKEVKLSFLDGYRVGDGVINRKDYSFSTSSFLMLSGISYLFDCLDFKYHINSNYRIDKNSKVEFSITQVQNNIKDVNEITKFIEIPAPDYLYDIETEDGTFVGGAGCIVHHNSHMAVQARLMGQALRILNGGISKHNCTVIFTNQLREKIGVTYGSNETTPGGNALKYYASVRLDVRRKSTILKGDVPIGNEAKVTVKKNKVGAPFKVTGFEIYYDEGISKVSEILEYAVNTGLILKAGAGWYTIFPETEKQQKIQGTEAVRQVLKENPVICNEIENKIRESFNLPLIM